MRRNYILIALGITIGTMAMGCSSKANMESGTEISTIKPTDSVSEENTYEDDCDYDYLEGVWTSDGKTKEEITLDGGTYIELTVENGKEVTGTIVSIQETSQRIASVEFEGSIEKDSLTYNYDDDGFENKGVLTFDYTSDSITVQNIVTEEGLSSPTWNIRSVTLKK